MIILFTLLYLRKTIIHMVKNITMSNCANKEFVRKNYICSVCNFCSLYPASIRRHIRLKHAGNGHLINRRESAHVSSACYSERNNQRPSMVNGSTMTSPISTQNAGELQAITNRSPGMSASNTSFQAPFSMHDGSGESQGINYNRSFHENFSTHDGTNQSIRHRVSPTKMSTVSTQDTTEHSDGAAGVVAFNKSFPISEHATSTPLQHHKIMQNETLSEFHNESPHQTKQVEVIHSGTDLGLSSAGGGDVYDISLIEQFKIFISGPSRCGKTVWVTDFLLNISPRLCKEVPETILYVFATWQPQYDDIKDSKLVDVFIQDDDSLESKIKRYITGKPLLIIFDDLISSNNLAYIADLFMIHGRHNHVSCIFISQMMFPNNIAIRSISRNSNYLVLFKNPRYNQDISELAKQMTPGQPYLKMIYASATEDPFSYLFINVTQECKPAVKFLSHLFNENNIVRAYVVT